MILDQKRPVNIALLIQQGLFKALGTPAEHWVGVPVYQERNIIGVLAAQSYDTEQGYSSQQINSPIADGRLAAPYFNRAHTNMACNR